MTQQTCKVITGIAFILRKNNKLFLLKRNSPGKIAQGAFALPGGTVENNETVVQTACREANEELGITIDPQDVSLVHMLRLREKWNPETGETTQILLLYVAEIKQWSGELKNREPHKHSDFGWFDEDDLPDTLFPLNKYALQHIKKGTRYAEHGW